MTVILDGGDIVRDAVTAEAELAKEEVRPLQWLAENKAALADANAFLDRHGLWSDGNRLF